MYLSLRTMLSTPGRLPTDCLLPLSPPSEESGIKYTVKWVMMPFGLAGIVQLTSTVSGVTSRARTLRGSEGAELERRNN